jgi:hypothetical protein
MMRSLNLQIARCQCALANLHIIALLATRTQQYLLTQLLAAQDDIRLQYENRRLL